MSERPEDRELETLELALRGLRPEQARLDRAVLMYRAGRASVRHWAWPLATLGAATLAAVFGTLLLFRPASSVVEQIVYLPAPEIEQERGIATEKSEIAGGQEDGWQRYLRMQEQVLRHGLEGLPPPPPTSANDKPETTESLMNAL